MVRVAHFISTSGMYGAEQWILGLLRHVNKKEVDPLLICPITSNTSLLKEAEKLNIRTILLRVKGNYSFFDFIKGLSKVLKRENIDILHTHGYKSDIIGYFAAKQTKTKIISTPHGWSFNAGLKLKFYESLNRFFLRFFDLVVPVSGGIGKSLRHIQKNKIKVINNFVDLNSTPHPRKGNFKLVAYIGQLIERKRVQDLIISLKYLKDIRLQIIGDGPKKQNLINLTERLNLQDRIFFLGFRKNRLDLLNNSEIMILPSLVEGTPRVVMEAMTMEKVVIGTNIPGTRELIKHKETGLLVPIKNPRKIAEAVNYVLKNKRLTKSMAINAKKLIEKKFSAERAAKEYEDLYNLLS